MRQQRITTTNGLTIHGGKKPDNALERGKHKSRVILDTWTWRENPLLEFIEDLTQDATTVVPGMALSQHMLAHTLDVKNGARQGSMSETRTISDRQIAPPKMIEANQHGSVEGCYGLAFFKSIARGTNSTHVHVRLREDEP